eukprot:8837210-Pyramimonas_sp.AAC.1
MRLSRAAGQSTSSPNCRSIAQASKPHLRRASRKPSHVDSSFRRGFLLDFPLARAGRCCV